MLNLEQIEIVRQNTNLYRDGHIELVQVSEHRHISKTYSTSDLLQLQFSQKHPVIVDFDELKQDLEYVVGSLSSDELNTLKKSLSGKKSVGAKRRLLGLVVKKYVSAIDPKTLIPPSIWEKINELS